LLLELLGNELLGARWGLKAPRGMGFVTNHKKAVYNRIYNKASVSVDRKARGIIQKVRRNPLECKAMSWLADDMINCLSCGINFGQSVKTG